MAMSWRFLRGVRAKVEGARLAREAPGLHSCLCRAIVFVPNWLIMAIDSRYTPEDMRLDYLQDGSLEDDVRVRSCQDMQHGPAPSARSFRELTASLLLLLDCLTRLPSLHVLMPFRI